ncbi:MAG TPA: hypothetical protein PK957_02830 [Candidatus Dojkabacteria bacterium]|nr:hypothetical protein [Candidatus Dojkabacteria bacterium]HQF36928.1 hypothetical protein [Candidatus Dojkabacteria bacterium]
MNTLRYLFSQPPGTIVTIDTGVNSGVCLNAVIRQSANLEYTNTPVDSSVADIGTQVLTLWVSPKDPAEPLFTLCDGGVEVASEEEMEYDLRKEIHFEIGFDHENLVLFKISQEPPWSEEET